MEKYSLRYQTVTVYLPFNPRKGVCDACGKSVHKDEIKTTQMHHYKYAYHPSTVKKNPQLAIENTLELCYGCHPIADVFRELFSRRNDSIMLVLRVHPEWFRKRFDSLAKRILYKPKPLNTRKLFRGGQNKHD